MNVLRYVVNVQEVSNQTLKRAECFVRDWFNNHTSQEVSISSLASKPYGIEGRATLTDDEWEKYNKWRVSKGHQALSTTKS